jgi:hypothetical protein
MFESLKEALRERRFVSVEEVKGSGAYVASITTEIFDRRWDKKACEPLHSMR